MKPKPIPAQQCSCCRRNAREDAETQLQKNELANNKIFAACFCGVWYCLAILDGWLAKLSRWIKRN